MKFTLASVSLILAVVHLSAAIPLVDTPAALQRRQEGESTVFEPCNTDSDCQQGCCGFNTGKCAGPAVAQTNGSGGCGHGDATPNCNVAAALGLGGQCIAGAINGDLSDPGVQAAAAFVSQLDDIPFTPQRRQEGSLTVFEPCTSDADCQQGCCGFNTGKCAGPAVAQTNGSGGCGFGTTAPNCNVAAALGLGGQCIAGAINGNLADPGIQAAAQFVSQLDGIAFTPQ